MAIKIIKEGTVPPARIWKGTCRHCGTSIQCSTDDGKYYVYASFMKFEWVRVRCPTCGYEISTHPFKSNGKMAKKTSRSRRESYTVDKACDQVETINYGDSAAMEVRRCRCGEAPAVFHGDPKCQIFQVCCVCGAQGEDSLDRRTAISQWNEIKEN